MSILLSLILRLHLILHVNLHHQTMPVQCKFPLFLTCKDYDNLVTDTHFNRAAYVWQTTFFVSFWRNKK